jgi:hypothetical protein
MCSIPFSFPFGGESNPRRCPAESSPLAGEMVRVFGCKVRAPGAHLHLTASRRRLRPWANCAAFERHADAFGLPLNDLVAAGGRVRVFGCKVRAPGAHLRLTASRRRLRPWANCAAFERHADAFGLPLNDLVAAGGRVRVFGCKVRAPGAHLHLTASRRRLRPWANCAAFERHADAFGLPLNDLVAAGGRVRLDGYERHPLPTSF